MSDAGSSATRFVVVGVGADGWDGLTGAAQDELRCAAVIYGSRRQLDLVGEVGARMVVWESPMSRHLRRVLDADTAGVVHIVASGDPMFHGVGARVVDAVGADRVRVLPTVSSVSLAAARLGWDLANTAVVSAVTADASAVIPELTDRARLLVLSRGADTPGRLATVLVDTGFGASTMTVLEQLGGPREASYTGRADGWGHPDLDPLNVVALDCRGPRVPRTAGLSETAFDHDGQITKSVFRAVTVAALAPGGRHTLWDVGAGSGSVGIEWLRLDAAGRAVAFESNPERRDRVAANADRHGVAHRLAVLGSAPDAFDDLSAPDTAFIGGGVAPNLVEAVWASLADGGRLVANAVTVSSQSLLAEWHARHGGMLRRVVVETVEPLGSTSTWRPALPIVQWVADKPAAARGQAS